MTKAQMRAAVRSGRREVELRSIAEKTTFYNLCDELGVARRVAKSPAGGWTGFVEAPEAGFATQGEAGVQWWLPEAPTSVAGTALRKYVKAREVADGWPPEWVQLCKQRRVLMRTCESEAPAATLFAFYASGVSSLVAATADGEELPMEVTVARGLFSVPGMLEQVRAGTGVPEDLRLLAERKYLELTPDGTPERFASALTEVLAEIASI